MKKNILLAFAFCLPVMVMAQLQIGPGTTWRSDNSTYVVLNNTDFQYDALTALLSNTFKFTGNASSNIYGDEVPVFRSIQLAKTGTGKLVLQRDFNLTESFDFQSGLCDLNGFAINLGSNALLLNENEASRIMGVDGYVRIIADLNAPTNANPGNMGAVITSSQNLGSTTIYRGVRPQFFLSHYSISRYYDILPTRNESLNATLRFNYLDAELNGVNENQLMLWKSPDNTTWTEIGFNSRDAAANYVLKTGIDDFSRWTLQLPAVALPVIFRSVNTRCENSKVIINWKTAQEFNSSRFDVERSENSSSWQVIGSVTAAGNSSTDQSYLFTDVTPLPAGGLYRIAEYDINGRVQYSGIVHLNCSSKDEIKVWPNPVKDIAWISITVNATTIASIRIFDAKGSQVQVQKISLSQGNNLLSINMKNMARGSYYLNLDWNNGQTHEGIKLIKQ